MTLRIPCCCGCLEIQKGIWKVWLLSAGVSFHIKVNAPFTLFYYFFRTLDFVSPLFMKENDVTELLTLSIHLSLTLRWNTTRIPRPKLLYKVLDFSRSDKLEMY